MNNKETLQSGVNCMDLGETHLPYNAKEDFCHGAAKRKPIRLPDYDYTSPGAYFVTICTRDRRCILSRITVGDDAPGGPRLQLTDTGKVVEQYILSTDRISDFRVEKYVVMPNHIHMILWIEGGPPRSPWPGPYGFGCGRRVEAACESENRP